MSVTKRSYVEKTASVNYLKRADECLEIGKKALRDGKYDAAAINFVHSGISAVDALCVHFLSHRHAGEKHEDAVKMVVDIKQLKNDDIEAIKSKFLRILRMKNMAEYEERSVKEKEAEMLFNNAEKLLAMIKDKL